MFVTRRTMKVILGFKLLYLLLTVLLLLAARSALYMDSLYPSAYQWARMAGEYAVWTYVITCLPGIGRRLGIKHKLLALVMIFRRYFGILMYMLVLIHVTVLRVVPLLFQGLPWLPRPWFEVFGSVAASMLFLLFVTSNDISTKRLGVWWHKIHQLTYVAMFMILLHLALQRVSQWTVVMAVLCAVQIVSYFVSRRRKAPASVPPPVSVH